MTQITCVTFLVQFTYRNEKVTQLPAIMDEQWIPGQAETGVCLSAAQIQWQQNNTCPAHIPMAVSSFAKQAIFAHHVIKFWYKIMFSQELTKAASAK